MSTSVLSARGQLGHAQRVGDAKRITEARRDLAAAKLEKYITGVVASAPPLTTTQRHRLAALITGGDAR